MKMSDHFDQDLKACDITKGLDDTKFGLVDGYGIVSGKMQMEAAAHAINQHDQLTAINQELVEALDHVINKRVSNLTLQEYSDLIKRAKEPANEG